MFSENALFITRHMVYSRDKRADVLLKENEIPQCHKPARFTCMYVCTKQDIPPKLKTTRT